jgi:hypothetical protein
MVEAAWVLGLVLGLCPPERAETETTYPEARETVQQRRQRLEEVAADIAWAAADSATERPVPLKDGRTAAAYLVAVAWKESGFKRDVDVGPCAPERVRLLKWCDNGRAKTMWQLWNLDEWPSRGQAAKLAVVRMRNSMSACRDLPPDEQLAEYASGNCRGADAKKKSRDRVRLAWRLLSQ